MFDIGFLEVILISIIGLIVLGPQRMPHAVRVLGRAFGKIRRTFRQFLNEINRQLDVEDLRESLQEQGEILDVSRQVQDLKAMANTSQQSMKPLVSKVKHNDLTLDSARIRKVVND